MQPKPNAFRGHEYNHSHFVTPRTCEGYYPEDADADIICGDIVVLVVALTIGLISVVWWLV